MGFNEELKELENELSDMIHEFEKKHGVKLVEPQFVRRLTNLGTKRTLTFKVQRD